MVPDVRKCFSLIFPICLAISGYSQNNNLTIGEAFNLKVGDTLIYRPYQSFQCQPAPGVTITCTYYGSNFGFTVINKILSNDSIIYSLQHLSSTLDSINTGPLVITHLDSTMENFNMAYLEGFINWSNCDLSNAMGCDTLAYYCFSDSIFTSAFDGFNKIEFNNQFFEFGYSIAFIEGIGLYYYNSWAKEYFPWGVPGGCTIQLAYYKSGSFSWIDSAKYFYTGVEELKRNENRFILYPNPVSDNLIVKSTSQAPNSIQAVKIYDAQMHQVHSITHFNESEEIAIDMSNLVSGVYFVSLENKSEGILERKKIIKF